MTLYTYQPQELVDLIDTMGIAIVEYEKTNLYQKVENEHASSLTEAYLWMARKLGEKTGLWLKFLQKDREDLPKDEDGDYIDEKGQKLPILPFWAWYLTNGKNDKPNPRLYCFDGMGFFSWNKSESKTRLLTLEVPEQMVLLSDANAWYCAMENRPCYEYESPEVEQEKMQHYLKRLQALPGIQDERLRREEARALNEEKVRSWDNILRTEGRRLKQFMGMDELYDLQAVFPVILKQWIVSVEDV